MNFHPEDNAYAHFHKTEFEKAGFKFGNEEA
jgi:hypothetical protein